MLLLVRQLRGRREVFHDLIGCREVTFGKCISFDVSHDVMDDRVYATYLQRVICVRLDHKVVAVLLNWARQF